MVKAMVAVALISGCDDDLPTCAALGCIYAPSGSPIAWEPCDAGTCWCLSPAKECEK